MYIVLGRGNMQEDMLTARTCYHTHGALIFNGRLMHPSCVYIQSSTTSKLKPESKSG